MHTAASIVAIFIFFQNAELRRQGLGYRLNFWGGWISWVRSGRGGRLPQLPEAIC
ncbi:hypothetical protein VDG1235_524 [Verrucomicrobiia bacterium DG1235]|nr:hypothetical protein VDG1235_524 [Verrucomicrobiae bacterium DG1235]